MSARHRDHVSERFLRLLTLYRRPDGSEWGGQEGPGDGYGRRGDALLRLEPQEGRIENPGLGKLEAIAGAMGFPPALWFGTAEEEGRAADDALLTSLKDETLLSILQEARRTGGCCSA